MISEKSVMENMAYPELCQHPSVLCSYNCHVWNNDIIQDAAHRHSQLSATDLKRCLLNCPQLTPASSHECISQGGQACINHDTGPGSSQTNSSSVQLPSTFNSHDNQSSLESNDESGCQPIPVQEEGGMASANSNIVSSYLLMDANSSTGSCSLDSASTATAAAYGKNNVITNDLSDEKEKHGIHSGVGTVPVANPFLPASAMYVPVNLTLSGLPSHGFMTYPIFNSNGVPAFVPYIPNTMLPASVYASAAASAQCAQNVTSVPPNFKPHSSSLEPGPLTANFRGGGFTQTLAARPNISVAPLSTSSTPSSEDNNSCSRSYSLQPDEGTRLVRLRKPVLDWLVKKLDMPCLDNWEALADKRGMNYEDIHAHLNTCRHTQQSPFLKLLETEYFRTYTVKEFLTDLQSIRRKDIIDEFGSLLERNT